jgi:hypothetical protein
MYAGSITSNPVTPSVNMKNRLINGNMVIDQRNAGASVTIASGGTYTLDRYQAWASASSKYTVQQNAGSVTPPAGFKNYLGVTSLAATSLGSSDYYYIAQKIEGFNIADLNFGSASASTITINFWVRSSLTGTFGCSISNASENRFYPFTYTISAANTWEQKTVTIAGDTSGTWASTTSTGIQLIFGLGIGTTYSATAGAWGSGSYGATGATSVVGTNGATWYITGVQLEVGSTATSFDYRSYGTELALCQRYFVKDLQNAASATFLIGVVASATEADRCGMRFPVTMRTAPTAAVGGTANPRIYDASGAPAITSIISNTSSSFGASLALAASGGGLTLGRVATIIDNNASFITYSAEL